MAIECLSVVAIQGIAMRSNLPKQSKDPSLVATFLIVTREVKSMLSECVCLLESTGQQMHLPEPGDLQPLTRHDVHSGGPLDSVLQ